MAEYIEREALNALLLEECSPKVAAYLIDAAAAIPAADVRPVVRGKWISKYPLSTCSVCVKSMILCDFANYCPNCGADMREGET